MSYVTNFVLLIIISGTLSLDRSLDARYQDDWIGQCVDGRLQSPIAIPNMRDRTLVDTMKIEYTNMRVPIMNITVTNSARQTVFEWERDTEAQQRSVIVHTSDDVSPFKPDTKYILQNFHIHHGMNEQDGTLHALNGSFYAMEMHFLFVLPQFDYKSSAAFENLGNALEIVVLWEQSKENNVAWTQLNDLMLSKQLSEGEKMSGDVDISLSDLLPELSTFSLYHGSLPGGKCSEGITWIVYDTTMLFDTADLGMRHWTYVSAEEKMQLKRNVRRIQSRNGRPVYHARTIQVVHN